MEAKMTLIKSLKTIVLAIIALTFVANRLAAQEVDVSKVLPDDYDPRMRPGNPHLTDKLNVSISLYVNDLLEVVDKDQTIHLDLIMKMEWQEDRLNSDAIGPNFVVTRASVIEKFWLPDFFFVNGLTASLVNSFQPVQKLTVERDGSMSYTQRIDAKFSCPLNLQNYPHDYQHCSIKLSTLTYNRTELQFVWKHFEARRGEYNIFKIRFWYTGECGEWENPNLENSCLSGTMKLVRRLSYYIIRYYLLTFLIMAITYCGMWLPINGWPARVTLLVMPLLNIITQDIEINEDIGVHYVTSFHWWMMWIQGFVYIEINEYAVAIAWAHFIADKKYYKRLLEEARQAEANGGPPIDPAIKKHLEGYYFGNKGWYSKVGAFFDRFILFFYGTVDLHLDPYTRNKVDYVCRVVFVGGFLFFVFLYVMITVLYWAGHFNDQQ